FDLAGEDYGNKMLTLISVFDIITGGLTENQKGVLNDALRRVYKKKGIFSGEPGTWGNNPPTFSDLHGVLTEMKREIRRSRYNVDEKSLEVLINRVKMYSKNGFFEFLDKQTQVNLRHDIIDFDLSELPQQVKQLVMFSVLELVSREIKKDKNPKVVLIDEGWSLLRSKEAENYILEFIKTSRKFNAAIGFITQEIEDLLRSDGGTSVLNTTSTKILLKQNASNLGLISKTLALNEKERDYLLRAEKGQGLLIHEHGRYQFIVKAPPMIHKLITTDPNDEQAEEPPEEPKEEPALAGLDLSRGYFEVKKLTEEQATALRKEGFISKRSLVLNSAGLPWYLVKPQGNESSEHALLCYAIAEEIRKRGGKPTLHATVDVDISFEIKKKKYGIEVETGTSLERSTDQEIEDRFGKKKLECDELIIVVGDRLKRKKYARLARTRAVTRVQVIGILDSLYR
ncbi:MAG: ATP-binding protein, partial [Candidatus Micrarchaeota archaeon]